MNRYVVMKTGVKRLQDRILISLISRLIALIGIVGLAAAGKGSRA